jgi:hypothetical protein
MVVRPQQPILIDDATAIEEVAYRRDQFGFIAIQQSRDFVDICCNGLGRVSGGSCPFTGKVARMP